MLRLMPGVAVAGRATLGRGMRTINAGHPYVNCGEGARIVWPSLSYTVIFGGVSVTAAGVL